MDPTGNEHLSNAPASAGANPADRRKAAKKRGGNRNDGVQGEGNYVAARAFNDAERKFVESGKVAAAARAAAPTSEAERQEMMAAEEEGRRRARDEDPALTRAWPNPQRVRTGK